MSQVLVAMSGGVDSAVAAALLQAQGHDVVGVHLKLAEIPNALPGQGCCTLDDAHDARRAAAVLDVPFYVWDLADLFEEAVERPFAEDYAAGRTPNPCVRCNERVKYAALLDRAVRLGFDALATGHHARLAVRDEAGEWRPLTTPTAGARLRRGADVAKDQSYVLYMATPAQLARTLLPVGELTKAEVRRRAASLGLRVAAKPDSYDICFVPDGDLRGWLRGRIPAARGEIVGLDGHVLGEHDGVWAFTIGQRRGLGLNDHRRRFVVDLDAARNLVVVGSREDLACRRLVVGAPTWTGPSPLTDAEPVEVGVQVRAHGRPLPGRLTREPAGGVAVSLDEPAYGVAHGQAAVWYRGDECLGGGRITGAERPARATA